IPEKDVAKLKHIHKVNMTRPETLTEFIDFAADISRTERYCLILWGHGIELLLDEDRRFGTSGKPVEGSLPTAGTLGHETKPVKRYLTPANLGKALGDTKLANGELGENHPKTLADALPPNQGNRHTLDIIGLDACSMSMIEVASAVQKYADFMIASQEDVPDVSFPYEKILNELRAQNVRGDVKKVCKLIPQLYKDAFHDYIATPGTGVKGITMASLDLQKTSMVTEPLGRLSTALLDASYDPAKRERIFSARQNTKDFVVGV